MKKFTETVQPERISGHRDTEGNWIEEGNVERIRNQLTSFWTLSTMLTDKDMRDKFFNDPKIQKMVMEVAATCEENKDSIQELLANLSKIETDSRKNDEKRV